MRNGDRSADQVVIGCAVFWLLALVVLTAVKTVSGQEEPLRPSDRAIPGATYTPTPEPDQCSECPVPGSFPCEMWPEWCYQCWADCGDPQASPTPTPPPTPTATATPPATPTPNGPTCELYLPAGGTIYLVVYYEHESERLGEAYSYTVGPTAISGVKTTPAKVLPGSLVRPCPCEGHPVGFSWHDNTSGAVLKRCGITETVYPPTPTPTPGPELIFRDGFETGDTSRWTREVE
jgi:hypothetical protein